MPLADRVERPDPATGADLCIFSSYEKPGWQARLPGDYIRAPHPGTAVSYQDVLYEVMALDAAPGAHAYRYSLKKWDNSFVVRKIVPYSAEAARAVAADIKQRRRLQRQHTWLVYLFPLTGLLPTPLLRRWQREWGLPMRGASFASVIFLGIPGLVLLSQQLFAATEPSTRLTVVLMFIALEQIVRFFWLLGTSEAVGSLTVTTAWSLLNPVRGRDTEGQRKRRTGFDLAEERDEVRHLKEQPWDLEVRSVFRDPVLVGKQPVRVEDAVYQPLEYVQEGKGLYRRYVFRLKKLEAVTEARREYRRERTPEQLESLISYERARDRVHALALVYGFLPAARQLELERRYDYLSVQATERSALVTLAAVGLQLAIAFRAGFGPLDLVPAYFFTEAVYRLLAVRSRPEPVGSVLGWLLQPFLRH